MKTYRFIDKPTLYLGTWYIKRKIQKRVKFIFFRFWRTMDTQHFGPYDSYLDAVVAIGENDTIEFFV